MHPLSYSRGTVVVCWRCLRVTASVSLRLLIIVTNWRVQISFLSISCLRPAPIPSSWSSATAQDTTRHWVGCCLPTNHRWSTNLGLTYVAVPQWLLLANDNLVVVVLIDSHAASWVLSVFTNWCTRLYLLRRTSTAPRPYIVETICLLHVLKIDRVGVWRADLFNRLVVFFFKFLKWDAFLLRCTQRFNVSGS